jgi:single-stranded-DNA-specific exonuclease
MKPRWHIKHQSSGQKRLTAAEIMAILLENRGLSTRETQAGFLQPSEPYHLDLSKVGIHSAQVAKAITRLKKAIDRQDQIVIYGDYDADGVTATAILWETLHALGAKVMPFIPLREEHGYGLNKKGIKTILANYPNGKSPNLLIITVDNGIVAFEGAEYLKKLGIDLIITDHHQMFRTPGVRNRVRTPEAIAIVWSDKLSGAGVAWFLGREIVSRLGDKTLEDYKKSNTLELAAIGTVADMMPLLETNRSLVFHGLRELRRSARVGLKALMEEAAILGSDVDTYQINFLLAPRLNAMGRLSEALDSLRLLCTNDQKRAVLLSQKLGLTNRERQLLTDKALKEADHLVQSQKLYKNKLLLVSSPNFNPGVIGLVAGKLVEKYYLPAIVMAEMGDNGKGSCRSVRGFNIIAFLRQFDNLFADVGGHPMAAGFNFSLSSLDKLKTKLAAEAKLQIDDQWLQPELMIDLQLDLADLSWEVYHQLEQFRPFGLANPTPLFCSRQVKLISFRPVGSDGKHLKLRFQVGPSYARTIEGIAFGLGHKGPDLSLGKPIDIAYTLEKNTWNGSDSLELRVRDIKTPL